MKLIVSRRTDLFKIKLFDNTLQLLLCDEYMVKKDLYIFALCEQVLRYEKCTRLDILAECIRGLVIVERRQQTDRKPHN